MAAPTRVLTRSSNFSVASSSRPTTATFDANAGDLIVVHGITDDNTATLTTPTATSLTFSLATGYPSNTGSKTKNYIWTATVPGGGLTGITLSGTISNSGSHGGYVVVLWRSHGGAGNVWGPTAGTGGPSASYSTSAANSAMCIGGGDWSATSGTITYRQVNSANPTESLGLQTAQGGFYVYDYLDAGASGAKTVGQSAPSQDWIIGGIEVLGTGGTSATVTAVPCTGVGDLPAPTVSGSSPGTVNAVPCAGVGDAVAPTLSAGAVVAAVACVATGNVAVDGIPMSAEVVAATCAGVGDLVVPAVSAGSNATVTAVPCDGVGDLVTPAVAADAVIVATVSAGAGALVVPAISGTNSATLVAVACVGVGDVPAPAVSGTGTAAVVAVACAGTGAVPVPAVAGNQPPSGGRRAVPSIPNVPTFLKRRGG